MGALPNTLGDLDEVQGNPSVLERRSEDPTVSRLGREVMMHLNGVGLVLINGMYGTAKFTSLQPLGNSVIDLFWVMKHELDGIVKVETIEEEKFRLSDHRFVIVTFRASGAPTKSSTTPLGPDCGERTRRWNIKGIGLQNRWGKLREAGNLIMAAWKPPLNCDTSDLKGEADVLWSHWLHDLKHTAEIGLGYAPVTPISYTAKIMTPAWRN